MEFTIYIAIYGAILSTIAIIWNILKDIKDKPLMIISASLGIITFHDNSDLETGYIFSAVNKSKHPITLVNAGIRVEENHDILFVENTNLPRRLEEGDKVDIYRSANKFYPEIDKHKPEYLWFRDTTGRIYKSKNIRNLFLKDYREK